MGCELLIVGNGPSADTPEVAREINEAEKVLRMNKFAGGRYIRRRCDIFCAGKLKQFPAPANTEVWWTVWPWRPFDKNGTYDGIVRKQTERYDKKASLTLNQYLFDLVSPKAPSTGFVAIHMAIELGYVPTIAGFDFFGGETHHYYHSPSWMKGDALRWHKADAEKQVVGELINQGKVKTI